MARVKWTSQALVDLEAIDARISRDAASQAPLLVERILEAVNRLEDLPRSGRVVPEFSQEDFREIILGNYRIVHLVNEDEVNILMVFD